MIFENGSLIQLYCAGFTLCVCLFVAKMSEWFAVYFIAIGALYQMSLYCLMGTMIEWKVYISSTVNDTDMERITNLE